MLTIAFESKRLFDSLTGFGTYGRTMISDLANYFPENRYILVAHEPYSVLSKQPTFCSPEVRRIVNLDAVDIMFPPDRGKYYWKVVGAKRKFRREKVNLYHGLTQQIPRSIRGANIPKILSVHDLIYKNYPNLCINEQGIADNLDYHDNQLRKACTASDRIIAVSESTKQDLVDCFSIRPEKINVIYPACDSRYNERISEDQKSQIKSKYGLPEKYLLYVGSMTERKNLLSIVKAMRILPPDDRLSLVIIGQRTLYTDTVLTYAEDHDLIQSLVFPDNVTTKDLPAVYQGAEIFIYTSLYEGFGMPILEALASGLPVITSNVSSMPEAAGPNSRLVNPDCSEEIATGISDILSNELLRKEMIHNGYLYSAAFNNEIVTKQIVNLYQDLQ